MVVQSHNYCLYQKEVERELGASEKTFREGEEIEVRLELIKTDFGLEEEKRVKKYILHKANRNMIYRSGQIGILPNFVSKSKISQTTICYYCSMEIDLDIRGKEEYIICIVCEVDNDKGFALCRKDLDDFCSSLESKLLEWRREDYPLADNPKLKKYLPTWWDFAIEYVGRVAQSHGVAGVLQGALEGNSVEISGPPEKITEFRRFVRAVTLPTGKVTGNSNKEESADEISLEVSWEDGKWVIQPRASNQFCKDWAKALRKAEDPLQTRNYIETYQERVVQDLKELKELIEGAKSNYYSLWKAFQLLKESTNADVLLALTLRSAPSLQTSASHPSGESQSLDRDFLEVLDVLQEYLTTRSQTK